MPPEYIQVDSQGDLTLIVPSPRRNGREYRFLVCSRTMTRASGIWGRMLATKPTSGRWTLKLQDPEWDGTHIINLIQLVHGRLDKVQTTTSVDHLFRVMGIVKKYDLYNSIKPVAKKWLDCARQEMKQRYEKLNQACIQHSFHTFLYIAWEFGSTQGFSMAAAKLLRYAALTDKGRLVVPTSVMNSTLGNPVFSLSKYQWERKGVYSEDEVIFLECRSHLGPSDIAATLRARRAKGIQHIMDFLNQGIDNRTGGDGHVMCLYGDKACDKAVLGELWTRIRSARGESFPCDASRIRESLDSLMTVLSHVFGRTLGCGGFHGPCSPHHKVSGFLHGEMSHFIDETKSFLTATYLHQLGRNSKRTHI